MGAGRQMLQLDPSCWVLSSPTGIMEKPLEQQQKQSILSKRSAGDSLSSSSSVVSRLKADPEKAFPDI